MVGQPAYWLKNYGLLHLSCGLGSGLGGGGRSAADGGGPDIHVRHGTGLSERDPFENILEHNQVFHDAKKWRDSD